MKVFYLEQNDMTQKSFELAMTEKGWEVYTAAPLDDFQHILDDWGADLLVIDYDSVGGKMSRFLNTEIPVAVTCEKEEDVTAFMVITKPFNPLEAVVELSSLFKG
ncbi:MAG: hypothetical protein KC493_07705 [Bacteriovoracaceae bacterium]|nr:hypothetical protein [Bacteriovoracaceae bacterium]